MTRLRKHEGFGQTNSEGIFSIHNRQLMEQFFKQWPDRRFSYEFKPLKEGDDGGFGGYFYAAIVPVFKQALQGVGYLFDQKETADFIRQFSSVMRDYIEVNGEKFLRLRRISDPDFTDEDWKTYLAELKQFLAEQFSIVIEDR